MDYNEYLKSPHWKEISRTRKYWVDGEKCVCCGGNENLNVHHKFYRNSWYDTQIDDLVTLCHKCHLTVHKIQEKFDCIQDSIERMKKINAPNVQATFEVSKWNAAEIEAARKLTVLCWEKNVFSTTDVSMLCRKIMDIVSAKGYNKTVHAVKTTMDELALVKDCYIANKTPEFDKSIRRQRQKRRTKYKK